MAVYLSDIKTISSSEEVVFGVLSNLESLAKIQDYEELDQYFKILNVNADSCTLQVRQFGKIELSITEKTPNDSIKFTFSKLPMTLEAEVKLNKIDEDSTAIQFVVDADMPKMLQMMFDKKLKKGVNVFADVFEQILNKHI